jgi:hypothetical protein
MTVPTIVHLDTRVSRASERGRGLKLEPADLDLLVSLGVMDILHRAKADYLKEQARCRDARNRSINGANTSSTGIDEQTAPSALLTSRSSGTMPKRSASVAVQRARQTKPPG